MFRGTRAFIVAGLVAGCTEPFDTGVVLATPSLSTTDPLARERLAACARDPSALACPLAAPLLFVQTASRGRGAERVISNARSSRITIASCVTLSCAVRAAAKNRSSGSKRLGKGSDELSALPSSQ